MRDATRRFQQVIALVVAMAAPATVWAHGGHAHLMGTVTAVDAQHIEVKAKDGKPASVRIDDKTTFKKQDKSVAQASDVTIGQRIMIDTEGKGDARTAREVTLGAKAKAKAK